MKSNDLFAHGSIFIFFCIICRHGASTDERFLCFQRPQNTALRGITYDETRNVLYVGAVDSIYQLSPALDILNSRQLGPSCSSGAVAEQPCKNCTDVRGVCSGNGELFSQMLLIDSTAHLLVACSNANNGSCRTFGLNDLSPTSTLREKISLLPSNSSVAAVGFIGRGQNGTSVLYVGVSYRYSPESDNSSAVPLVSIRNPSSLELVASVIDLNQNLRHTFSIEFIAAFQSARFAYFFVRRESSGALAAFLLRICKDKPKKTLVELPVQCNASGSSFPHLRAAILAPYSSDGKVVDAVYAIFTKDSGSDAAENSTLCVYLISEVNQEYQKAIQNCFDGIGVKGPRYATTDTRPCIQMNLKVDTEFCTEIESNSPIEGNVAIQPHQAFPLPVKVATSLTSSVINGVLILYIGGSSGQLLKATFGSRRSDQLSFDWISIPIIPDKVLGPIKTLIAGATGNLYLLTDNSLCRAPAYDCTKAVNCEQCTADPYCGWCMENRRCTPKHQCSSSSTNMEAWLYQLGQCPVVTKLQASMLPANVFSQSSVVVNVNYIPANVSNVSCTLKDSGQGYVSDFVAAVIVNRSDDGCGLVACSPLGSPPQMNGSTSVNLTLAVSFGGVQWFTAHVMVFNCSQVKSCTECVDLGIPCRWSSDNHICHHQPQLQEKATGNQSSVCSRIELTNGTGSLLVTGSGQNASFRFAFINIMPLHRNSDLRCRFGSANGKFVYRTATLQNQTTDDVLHSRHSVVCGEVQLKYVDDVASEFFTLDLVWGSNSEFVIDNPLSLKVEVFKCLFKASNCGHCLLLDQAYGCIWCFVGCMHPSDCRDPAFLQRGAACPNPRIDSFSPRGGPVAGQTILTIHGINLGRTASDLTIRVADRPCEVMSEGYHPTDRVLCQTGKADSSCNGTVYLSLLPVKIAANSTESQDVYTYKDPNATSFNPRKGPLSGGTCVTVVGTDLDYGSTLEVFAVVTPDKVPGETVKKPATFLWRNGTHLAFVMPRYDLSSSVSVYLNISIDGFQLPLPLKMNSYTYYEDPKITSVSPTKSLLSGGNRLEIRGTGLQLISQPLFVLYVGNRNITTICTSPQASFMFCSTPDLRNVDLSLNDKLEFDFGFVMDGVESLLRIKEETSGFKQLHYFRDPYIAKFKSPVAYTLGTPLVIYGENLMILQVFTDLNISINGLKCTSPSFSHMNISCHLPHHEPKNLNENGDALIVVALGNFVCEVGYLSYHDYGLSTTLITGIACGVAVPLLIGMIILVVFLIRSHRSRSRSLAFGRMEGSRKDRSNNSYSRTEMEPLNDNHQDGGEIDYESLRNDDGRFIQNLLRKIENPRRRNAAREILVSRDRLDMGNIIGRGHFSCVYLATLKDVSMRNSVQVAAKTVEVPVLDEKILETILRESVVMSNFNHPRLVSFVGLCLNSQTNPIVLLPFMSNGNLRTYIKDKSKNFTARQLLLMSQQVAEGMSYLSSCDLVHRNLAARNCLLDENLEVKVSDFVLCHELFEHGLQYGSPDEWGKLPIKWMAPETLEGFVFTSFSDVWSFGVLVWELMTRGITPYSEVALVEMKAFLNAGQRLKKPKYCPETVYRIMADCWQKVAERRPSFPDLVNRLEVLLNPPRKRTATSSAADEEPLYVNMAEPSSPGLLRSSLTSPNA